jgi:26S proteasome non-ATPase regulatory subunit 5
MKLCQNPFPDLSLAALGFLKSICLHRFGQQAIANTGGFVEWLLDRTMASTKEIKQEKYEIVKILSETNSFDAPILMQLKKFVRDGAFYIQGVTEIAFEGST